MNIKFKNKKCAGFTHALVPPRRDKAGFTLMEIIVVFFILTLVFSSGLFISFDREKYRLESATTVFSAHLRKTRDQTLNRVIDPLCQKWYPENEHCDQYEIHVNFKGNNQKYTIIPVAEAEMGFLHIDSYQSYTLQPGVQFVDPTQEATIQFLYIPNNVIRVTPSYQESNENFVCDGDKTLLKNFTLGISTNFERSKTISILCNSDIFIAS